MHGNDVISHRGLQLFAVLMICLLANGCSAPGPRVGATEEAESKRFEVPNGLAKIYVYRDQQFWGSMVLHKVTVDDERMGVFGPGGFLVATVQPGEHEILIEASGIMLAVPDFLTLTVEADEIYFVRHWIDPHGRGEDVLQTELVPAEEAKKTLVEKRFHQVKWVK